MALLTRWGTRSRAILHFRADDCTLNTLTGHSATFVRASAATATDSAGVTYTAGQYVPCWQVSSGAPGLLIRPADAPRTVESLTYTVASRIIAHSGYLRFIDRGAGATADARYLQWGNGTAPRLIIQRGSTGPVVNWDGGSGAVTSEGTAHQTSGQLVELFWWLSATGTVELHYRYAGGAIAERPESSTSTAPPLTPAASTVSIGHLAAANVGGIELQRALIWPDPEATVAELEAAF